MNTTSPLPLHAVSTTAGDLPKLDTQQSSAVATPQVAGAQDRALILGGGGSTGHAWLIGVIAGLFEAGLNVTNADVTIGTSAGSTAAAQLAWASPTELFGAILAAPTPQRTAPGGPDRGRVRVGSATDHLERLRGIIASAQDPGDMRRRVGAAALESDAADSPRQAQWRTTVAARLPSQVWPERKMLITAVDAHTGEPVLFDRHSGVDLVDAVAASCAGGFAYSIGERRYLDGGYRANAENADLAAGYARILVLSPLGGRTLLPLDWGLNLTAQVEKLRAGGSGVETIFPDPNSEHLFGAHAMDLSLRPAAARAGYSQGSALAEQLTGFWRGPIQRRGLGM